MSRAREPRGAMMSRRGRPLYAELFPKGRNRCCVELLAEWHESVVIIEHETQSEALAASLGELAQAGEVALNDRRGGFDFYADDVPAGVLDDDVDFIVVTIAEVKEFERLVAPARKLQQLPEHDPTV